MPQGVAHCPVAEEEAHLLLIEKIGTLNTGDPATAAVKTAIRAVRHGENPRK